MERDNIRSTIVDLDQISRWVSVDSSSIKKYLLLFDNFILAYNTFYLFTSPSLIPILLLLNYSFVTSPSTIFMFWFCDPLNLIRIICITMGGVLLEHEQLISAHHCKRWLPHLLTVNSSSGRMGPQEPLCLSWWNVVGPILCKCCTGSYSCHEFESTITMSYAEPSILQHSFLSYNSYTLSVPSFVMFPEACRGDVDVHV